MKASIMLLIVLALVSGAPLAAQDAIAVPNVIGLTVPRATAILNRAGLSLGAQSMVTWTPEAAQASGRINEQSIAPGEMVEPGASLNVTVFGTPNATLVYDDNDLTLVNLTAATLSMENLAFSGLEGGSAYYAASRWGSGLQAGKCFQIWAVSQNQPKSIDGCGSIQNWRWTGNASEHFWTTSSGVTRFSVTEAGMPQAICEAAAPGSDQQPLHCDFSVGGGSLTGQATDYVYFAYTTGAFVFSNPATDQWMPTEQTTLYNYNPQLSTPGLAVHAGDPALYGNPFTVANIRLLAPGQCLLFTSGMGDSTLPEPCDVVASIGLSPDVAFWLAGFEVSNANADVRRQCPAAEQGKTVVCILPR